MKFRMTPLKQNIPVEWKDIQYKRKKMREKTKMHGRKK